MLRLWLSLSLSIAFGLQHVAADTQFDRAFVRQPHNASLIEGSDHILFCDLSTTPKEVMWLRQNLAIPNYELFANDMKIMPGFLDKFTFPSDSSRINYRVMLRNASVVDEGFYKCIAYIDDVQYISAAGYVKLLIPPQLTINNGNETNCTVGKSCSFTCITTYSYPEPTIEWIVRGLEEKAVCEKTTKTCPGLTCFAPDCKQCTSYTCKMSISATRSDHDNYISCQATGLAIRDRVIAETRLNILFKPVVKVEVYPDHVVLQERLRVVFSCIAESRPSPEIYRWTLGGKLLPCVNSTCVMELSREHHGQQLVCTVTNAVGSSSASFALAIVYPPRFTHQKSVYFANEQDAVTMQCEVDANPPTRISWFKQTDPDSLLVNGTTFAIERLSSESFGEYTCVAYSSSELYQSIHVTSIHLIEKFAPRIAGLQQVYATLQNTAEIACRVEAAPLPMFIWSRDGVQLQPINDSFSVSMLDFISGRTSVLKLRSVQPLDLGDYTCTATNELGAIDVPIRVSEHKPYLQYVVLLAIGVSAVTVCATCVALLLYYTFNKRNKRLWTQRLCPDSTESLGTRFSTLEPYELTLTSVDADADADAEANWNDVEHSTLHLHESLVNSTLFDTSRTGNARESTRTEFKSNTEQLDDSEHHFY